MSPIARNAAWRCSGDVNEFGKVGVGPLGNDGSEGSFNVFFRFGFD